MTKSKKTKRALLSSALALVLCFVMLLGTTFAWFTDTASTKVNTIQAGTLDILLEMATEYTKTDDGEDDVASEWENAEGKTLSFLVADEDGNLSVGENILWEPGCFYATNELRITNKGNLALKFKLDITGIDGDDKLNEVIEWMAYDGYYAKDGTYKGYENKLNQTEDQEEEEYYLLPGEYTIIQLSGYMDPDAGNEYQGLSINGAAVTVYATQYTYEYDSTGNTYDAGAEYVSVVSSDTVADPDWYDAEAEKLYISDAADFLAFMETAYTWGVTNKPNVPNFKGQTVVLNADVYLPDGYLWTPISPYDSMYKGNGGFQGTFDGQGHTIYNLNVTNENKTGRGYRIGLFGEVGDGAVFKNLTIDGANTYAGNSSAGAVCALTSGNVTFENITVRNSTIRQGRYAGGIVGDIRGTSETTVTFKNCTVENSAIFNIHNNYCGALYGAKDSGVNIVNENCTITNVVKHFFKDSEGNQDWNTYHYISLEDALTRYANEPATEGGN